MKKFLSGNVVAMSMAVVSALCGSVLSSCGSHSFDHPEVNSVYFWKTQFAPDSADIDFIRKHDIGRIYLRMFDVGLDKHAPAWDDPVVPLGTVRFPYGVFSALDDTLRDVAFVPVVYITLDALKSADERGRIADLAFNIVGRVRNMCSFNEIPNVEGIQLDCDWTKGTEDSFFRLCDYVREAILREELPWSLSSTVRLHQLRQAAPPVDYGVLMVYNTGSFDNPDERNSIISLENVAPYLKRLSDYPLHLDVAYPTYSWQLLFRGRDFRGLLNGVDVADTARFGFEAPNRYVALEDIPYRGNRIVPGDMIKLEESGFDEIAAVKKEVDRAMGGRTFSNILYHLDSSNLSKYNVHEINEIYGKTEAR